MTDLSTPAGLRNSTDAPSRADRAGRIVAITAANTPALSIPLVSSTLTTAATAADGDCLTLAHLRALVLASDGLPGCLPVFGKVGYSDLYSDETVDSLTVTSTPERTYCRASGCLDRADQVVDHRAYCTEHADPKWAKHIPGPCHPDDGPIS